MQGINLISKLTIFIITLLVFSHPALAQQGKNWRESRDLKASSRQHRVFNPETVQTISGKVVGLKKISPMKGMSYGLHLQVDTGKEIVPVHLGPVWFIEEQDMVIKINDNLSITGSRVNFEGRDVIIASLVKKDNQILELRDENGFPVWSGWKRKPDGVGI